MSVSEGKIGDGFTATAWHGVLPLMIWAAHFFLSYASAEIACALDLQRISVGGVSLPSVWLWTITVAALASLVGLTALAVRRRNADAVPASMLATVRVGAALLAMIGVLWSSVPIAFAPLCGP